ncbi:MAG: M15 family metallopeptidase [Clostridia bacterium]|nr:M15 family metallopeptidase [Clostridia bacterium]
MSRDITMCHPQLQELADKLLTECKKQGLIVKLGECFRTAAEQDTLYAQGRTASGSIVTNAKGSSYLSMHQWGVAFDVIRNDGKGAYYNGDGWFSKVGKVGKALGLEWGGDWTSPVDLPHFQLPQWGSTPTKLKKLYGNVENFKKTWEVDNMTDERVKEISTQVANDMIYKYVTSKQEAVYDTIDDVPEWGKATVKKLIQKGVLQGSNTGLDMSYSLLRLLVINDRAGLYD